VAALKALLGDGLNGTVRAKPQSLGFGRSASTSSSDRSSSSSGRSSSGRGSSSKAASGGRRLAAVLCKAPQVLGVRLVEKARQQPSTCSLKPSTLGFVRLALNL
jgi:hypothetical protein